MGEPEGERQRALHRGELLGGQRSDGPGERPPRNGGDWRPDHEPADGIGFVARQEDDGADAFDRLVEKGAAA